MKVTKTFSVDTQILSEVERYLNESGEKRNISQFVEDATVRELARCKRAADRAQTATATDETTAKEETKP